MQRGVGLICVVRLEFPAEGRRDLVRSLQAILHCLDQVVLDPTMLAAMMVAAVRWYRNVCQGRLQMERRSLLQNRIQAIRCRENLATNDRQRVHITLHQFHEKTDRKSGASVPMREMPLEEAEIHFRNGVALQPHPVVRGNHPHALPTMALRCASHFLAEGVQNADRFSAQH